MKGKRAYIRAMVKTGKNNHMLASCYGKARYHAADKERVLAKHPSFIAFYKCQHCEYFHVGRKPT